MKFKTAIFIEIEVAEATQAEINKDSSIVRPLCEMVTQDMISIIKSNVAAKGEIHVKGSTILAE